jgi:hypothetical protein
MDIKSDNKKKKKPTFVKVFSLVLLVLTGIALMLIALVSPWVYDWQAFIVFVIGASVMETPYNKLMNKI